MSEIKILAINDSAAMQVFLKEVINEMRDCQLVHCSSNGELGLIYLERNKPDLIILDLEMPHLDGLTFLEKLSQMFEIPVIILSAYANEGSAMLQDALGAGACDYILPPSRNTPEEIKKFKATLNSKIHKNVLLNNMRN